MKADAISAMIQSHKLSCITRRKGNFVCNCGRDQAEQDLAAMQAQIEKLERIKIAAGQVSKNLSKTEIIDIDNKEFNVWSIVGDAEKDELVAALKEAE